MLITFHYRVPFTSPKIQIDKKIPAINGHQVPILEEYISFIFRFKSGDKKSEQGLFRSCSSGDPRSVRVAGCDEISGAIGEDRGLL